MDPDPRNRQSVFLFSEALEEYSYPEGNPFNLRRAGLARERVEGLGLLAGPGRRQEGYGPATRVELERFHTPSFLDALAGEGKGLTVDELVAFGLASAECPLFPGVYDYGALVAGGTLTGARVLLAGEADQVFHPAGGLHHAMPAAASGFCYVNDTALACRELADAGRRVLYLDIDAHHGDGVQAAFYSDPRVLTVSLHESGETLFPGTGWVDELGEGAGRGYAVNLPLPAGTYDAAWWRAFTRVVPPLVQAYDPEAVVLEIGMDCLAGDPLTHLELTNNVYADAIERVVRWGRPLLAVGGGGYNVKNTARGWALAWTVLVGEDGGADDMALGLGGVMLESHEWAGGLRDRQRFVHPDDAGEVDTKVDAAVAEVEAKVFPLHGIDKPGEGK